MRKLIQKKRKKKKSFAWRDDPKNIVIEFPTKLMFTRKQLTKIPRMCSKQPNKQNIINNHRSVALSWQLFFLFFEILF